ncbi:early nodulin-like protein 9 [Actinidia eriantha]|uniref:early nodulin-like protein 9 n=1 Tax=Actinidia eriantha TaxID=165200 RepID=UPI00258FFDD6|nr:early nodulin-like protein 9 [Actinidia eriantha]
MEAPSRLVFLLIYLLTSLLLQFSDSTKLVVDGVSEWRNPSVHIGDSIIFKHKNNYKLYIFQNRGAFNLCNFTQATLLTKPNSNSFTWHPSRPGFFYFSFNNDSTKPCQQGQKLAIKVSSPPPPESSVTAPAAAPAPVSGGMVSSSPAFPWPFQPRESDLAPSPAPSVVFPSMSPSLLPEKGGGIPFINSNPAVPLPTGEVDSATIRPLPTSGHGGQVVGLFAVHMALCFVVLLLLL